MAYVDLTIKVPEGYEDEVKQNTIDFVKQKIMISMQNDAVINIQSTIDDAINELIAQNT